MLHILSTMVSVYTATTAASSTTAISNIMVDGVDISEFEFDDDSSRSSVQSLLTQLGGAIPVDGAGAGVPEEVGSNKDDSSGNLEVISVLSLVTQEDQVAEDQDQVDGDQEENDEGHEVQDHESGKGSLGIQRVEDARNGRSETRNEGNEKLWKSNQKNCIEEH